MRTTGGMRRFILMCPLLFSLLAAGCGQGGTVSGKIYYKGEPVSGGTIYFYPKGQGGNYASVIGKDGSYSIAKLPPGPAKISVIVGSRRMPTEVLTRMRGGQAAAKGIKAMEKIGRAASEEPGNDAGAKEPGNTAEAKGNKSVPEKYADPEKSGLTIDVTGGKQTHDIKLE